jgi:N-ethylmaleimide reductase
MISEGKATVDLFTPIKVGPLMLPNRIIMAPLTRNRAGPGDVPRELNATYYAQRASAGLIISEASPVASLGHGYPATPGIHTEAQVEGWQMVTRALHARGGRIFLQLWHVGRISHPSLLPEGELPVAPSAIRPAGEAMTFSGPQPFVTPRALDLAEIPRISEQYRRAAENGRRAGFDGVEVHAANGYLLDQFLRDGTNRRDDAYGGSLQNRTRLLMEVIDAVTAVWGTERVGVRLSPLQPFNDMRDSDPETTFSYVVEQLNDFDLAYLHVTEMGRDAPGAAGPAFDLTRLRELWHGLYMTNYRYDKASASAALAAGTADLIAFGELFLANPDLPERFAHDAPLNIPDAATFYGGDEHGYTDYPFMETHQQAQRTP